ncbi:MAG: tetratricopeptide repeat protein [Deltaproteobacteria bacterium]|nr:tetratricopeptide repeat protein [Deltaproteobacteria bacterium]
MCGAGSPAVAVWRRRDCFILLTGIFLAGLSLPAISAASGVNSAKAQKDVPWLLKKAKTALQKGKLADAATAFYEIYLNFPAAKAADNALWQTAKLREKIAVNQRHADFDKVRALFQSYINNFPKSARIPEAYLGLALSYYHMRFYIEASNYLKLFIEEYPSSPLLLQAKKLQGETLMKTGREAEAEKLFQAMLKDKKKANRTAGNIAMGDLRYVQGRYRLAKNFYQMVILGQPNYYLMDPEILRKAGMADLKFGKIARGRQELYHYLSLERGASHRDEVLAALANSYYLSGAYQMANTLFEQVIKDGAPGTRAVLLANLRLAQYNDGPAFKKSKWSRPQDLADVSGDEPYLAVLNGHHNGFMAQEARYGLFMRYKARKDLADAYDIGRSFLRNSAAQRGGSLENKRVGNILLYLAQEFLRAKKYQKIYDLYFVDYRHVNDFPDGRLLYMVGQAMEALGLYNQAAVVYYRALKWPLADKDRADLYFRRAGVYLILKNYAAADRLLTWLRKLYKGTGRIGEVFFYSGRLAAAKDDNKSAMDYYQQAVFSLKSPALMPEYAGHAMGMALKLGLGGRAYDIWREAGKVGGIKPAAYQNWAVRVGDVLRQTGLWDKAAKIYKAGLAGDLPAKGRQAQLCNLYLGDTLLALGNKTAAVTSYKKAAAGGDADIIELAKERLRQNDMAAQLRELKKAVGK